MVKDLHGRTLQEFAAALRRGERRALARAITLAESTRPEHRRQTAGLLALLPPAGEAGLRIGLSGPPGAGKSTFIEALGNLLVAAGRRPAVLAVDPSSRRGGGAILGDKTRMDRLANDDRAFVRPSPSGLAEGGVADGAREAMLFCEAAGFDVIVMETVGVGQSETAVAEMTDLFVLLLPPGGGDELQGLKRGVMELVDILLVNKADGALKETAIRTAADYAGALRLLHGRGAGADGAPTVLTCSALTGAGMQAAWAEMERRCAALCASGQLPARRAERAADGLWRETTTALRRRLQHDAGLAACVRDLQTAIYQGRLSPAQAAEQLLRALSAAAAGSDDAGDVANGRENG